MAVSKNHSFLDHCLLQFDQALRTCVPGSSLATRPSPADPVAEEELSAAEKKHIIGLMRINHTGEVCAQALYAGQAASARLDEVKDSMDHAAQEEADHLAWCDERLKELDSHPSLLNPFWYGLSFGMGAIAGLAGDKWSLGFVHETEEQVVKHLDGHLDKLSVKDLKTRSVIEQMRIDEEKHSQDALEAGAEILPNEIKELMSKVAKVMTDSSYHI